MGLTTVQRYCTAYDRRFISEIVNVAAPLHELTRKNARFIWVPEQDRAFRLLMEKLTVAPILGMPRE